MQLNPRPRPPWHGWSHYKSFFKCPQRFIYEQVYDPIPAILPSEGRNLGTLCHAGVGQWLLDPNENPMAAIDHFSEGGSIRPETIEKAKVIVEKYIHHWIQRVPLQVKAIEYENAPQHLPIGGFYDAVVTVWDKPYILEHKFQAESLGDQFKRISRDGQILTYCVLWGERELAKFGPLAGVIADLTDTRGGVTFARETIEIDQLSNAVGPDGWWAGELAEGIRTANIMTHGIRHPQCTQERFVCPYEKLCFGGKDNLGYFIERPVNGKLK